MRLTISLGSNTGLGYEAAKVLATSSKPYHIVITSRTLSKAEEAANNLKALTKDGSTDFTAIELDVSNPSSVSAALKTISSQFPHIDVLVNNSGLTNDRHLPPLSDTSPQAIASRFALFTNTLQTNVVGAEITTAAFLPLLSNSPLEHPRLLFVSSGLGSLGLASTPGSPFYALPAYHYRASKAAVNMMAIGWSKAVRERGVLVWAVDPGFNATGLSGSAEGARARGAMPPEVGGGFIASVVRGEKDGDAGRFVSQSGSVIPW